MGLAGELGLGFMVNLLWAGAGVLGALLYARFRTRGLRSIWRTAYKAGQVIVVVSNVSMAGVGREYKRPVTGMGELIAFGYVTRSISSVPRKLKITCVTAPEHISEGQLSQTIVSLGGTQFNPITKFFLERCDNIFDVINDTPKKVIDRRDGTLYLPKVVRGSLEVDYGIITFMANPLNEDHRGLCETLFEEVEPDGGAE
jgi:hypothetical protein